jgi:tetratricopeptide (TPR) repeat protein
MSKCTNKAVGDMLYEYELGLLNEKDADLVEAHLLECTLCRELALEHGRVSELMRQDDDVRALVGDLAGHETGAVSGTREVDTRRRGWSFWLRPIAVAAVLVALLILKPWNLQFQPSEEAVATDRVLAVMPFDNIVDPADSSRLAAIVTHLLTTDLSESQSLRVVSSRTVFDLSDAWSSSRDSTTPEEMALRIARASRATWVLTGSVVQVEPGLAMTARLVEVVSGETVRSHRVQSQEADDVFTLVDDLAARIRNDILAPLGLEDRYDPAVANVTTKSAVAYRYYLEGIEFAGKWFRDDARRSWERAIEIDSTFAMCYFYLARTFDRGFTAKAVEYSVGGSRRERLHILSLEAIYNGDLDRADSLERRIVELFPEDVLAHDMLAGIAERRGRLVEAARHLQAAIEVDPAHKEAYNSLAYLYFYMGKPEQAIRTAETYVAAVPGEPNPYDTRADILSSYGHVDEAIEDYMRVLELKPHFADCSTLLELGELYKYRGEYDRALEYFRQAATFGSPAARSSARTALALVPLFQGKLADAWQVLADGMGADRMEQAAPGGHGPGQKNHFVAGLTHLGTGDYDRAVEELATTIDIADAFFPRDSVGYRALYAFALAQSGHMDSAEAVIVRLGEHIGDDQSRIGAYWIARGLESFARGDYRAASDSFERVPVGFIRESFSYQFWFGRTLLEDEKWSEAADMFERALIDYSDQNRSMMAVWGVQAHYYLAQTYEKSGRLEEAVDQYQRFVDIWESADSVLQPMVTDARSRLTQLQSTP